MRMLPPEEALEFARRLDGDEELRQLVSELEAAAAQLAHAAPVVRPPAELRSRILDRFQREQAMVKDSARSYSSWASWSPWAIAACAVGVACALFLENQNLRTRLVAEKSARFARPEVPTQLVKARGRDALADARIATLASKTTAFEKAAAVVVFDEKEQQGVLKLENFPAPASDRDYQLWVIEPGGAAPVSAGVVKVGAQGLAKVTFKPAHPLSGVDAFAISVEEAGGSPTPKGEIVFVGK